MLHFFLNGILKNLTPLQHIDANLYSRPASMVFQPFSNNTIMDPLTLVWLAPSFAHLEYLAQFLSDFPLITLKYNHSSCVYKIYHLDFFFGVKPARKDHVLCAGTKHMSFVQLAPSFAHLEYLAQILSDLPLITLKYMHSSCVYKIYYFGFLFGCETCSKGSHFFHWCVPVQSYKSLSCTGTKLTCCFSSMLIDIPDNIASMILEDLSFISEYLDNSTNSASSHCQAIPPSVFQSLDYLKCCMDLNDVDSPRSASKCPLSPQLLDEPDNHETDNNKTDNDRWHRKRLRFSGGPEEETGRHSKNTNNTAQASKSGCTQNGNRSRHRPRATGRIQTTQNNEGDGETDNKKAIEEIKGEESDIRTVKNWTTTLGPPPLTPGGTSTWHHSVLSLPSSVNLVLSNTHGLVGRPHYMWE